MSTTEKMKDPLRECFTTTESGGGEYRMVMKFPTLADMQAGHRQLIDLLAQPAEQRQGEPVALPKHRYDQTESCNPYVQRRAEGWNACLDEVAKLGPLYTHADPGEATAAIKTLQGLGYTYHGAELWKPPLGKAPDFSLVDQLREEIEHLKAGGQLLVRDRNELRAENEALACNLRGKHALSGATYTHLVQERDSLRAQLAVVTGFVQRMVNSAGNQPSVATGYLSDILDVLKASASAEPSAAVAPDEFKVISMGSNDLINGEQIITHPDGTVVVRDQYGETTWPPHKPGKARLVDPRDSNSEPKTLLGFVDSFTWGDGTHSSSRQLAIAVTGDSISEGSDLLGKGLGRIIEDQVMVEMVDAAMVEMQNISPPLKRSDCLRLIRAAMGHKP